MINEERIDEDDDDNNVHTADEDQGTSIRFTTEPKELGTERIF
jgi:hypothetical protein